MVDGKRAARERPSEGSTFSAAVGVRTDVAVTASDAAVAQTVLVRAFDAFIGAAFTIGLLVLLARLSLLRVLVLLLGLARLALLVLLPGLLALGVVGLLLQALVVAVLAHGHLLSILMLAARWTWREANDGYPLPVPLSEMRHPNSS
ncbi:hypothetical protein DDF62_15910 [Caulobacter radicis]|uniref:Uncharacterized protein n=1 Tax=Caulobacter radicis TaxID=2172650 RepID=A0A2T9IYP4_9CAUL|nr:hypothetical protein DDF65_22405 [Caulobacter radicis]PVM87611.1 hypothetical protein DDF62_15910 [Caulobacter radicis]